MSETMQDKLRIEAQHSLAAYNDFQSGRDKHLWELFKGSADVLDAKDAEIAELKQQVEDANAHARDMYAYAAEQDSCHACPICHSLNVEQTHPAGDDDFGAFKCHDCGHQGEIGEDFPSGTALRAKIAKLEAELAEARAVVERLPETHDEKPIVDGDSVWWVVSEDPDYWGYAIGEPVEFDVESTRFGIDFDEYNGTHTVQLCEGPECGNKDLYSTRGAALADWHEDELGVYRRSLPTAKAARDEKGGGV